MDRELARRLIDLKRIIASKFTPGHWNELALLTGHSDLILQHPRLLRSLTFGDDDYEGNVINVLQRLAEWDPAAIDLIESYLSEQFGVPSASGPAPLARPRLTVTPTVFALPEQPQEHDLVSVMMPFQAEFLPVFESIKQACASIGFRCLRVDDIWEHSVIVQDIFNLVFRARAVVVDFSGRNSNVMYETGIAHTLGREVVPISQSLDDVPFDLRHHRVLKYLNNLEGRQDLVSQLAARLKRFATSVETAAPVANAEEDDIPF